MCDFGICSLFFPGKKDKYISLFPKKAPGGRPGALEAGPAAPRPILFIQGSHNLSAPQAKKKSRFVPNRYFLYRAGHQILWMPPGCNQKSTMIGIFGFVCVLPPFRLKFVHEFVLLNAHEWFRCGESLVFCLPCFVLNPFNAHMKNIFSGLKILKKGAFYVHFLRHNHLETIIVQIYHISRNFDLWYRQWWVSHF